MTARTKKPAQNSEPQLAYSYIRFSTPEQAKGDSLRRQMQAAADWSARHNVTLDTSTTLHDLGKSAFLGEHRKNPDRHALAAFLKLVETGKVPRGSALIVESLDRLSREHIRPALTLLLQLIEAGVRVVQLIPVEAIYDDKVEPMQLMMAIMELSRGHSESAVKSERIGSAWADKKARAREEGHILTLRLPAWVTESDGKLVLIPKAAEAVRRVYELARSGYGHQAIAKKLTADKVAPITKNGIWMRSYVAGILSDRRAAGELQPRKRDGSPDGEPITDYYPRVVTEEEWHAARSAASTRRRPGTTKAPANGSIHNLFAGLITDARNGGSYYAVQRADGRYPPQSGEWPRVLINTKSVEGQVPCVSFPVEPFERGILAKLREINPRELIGNTSAPNESAALAAELTAVEASIGSIVEDMDANGESPVLFRRLRVKEARQKELADALAVARAAEATPVSAAWGEFQTLVDMLDTATDREDTRYRLRGALRRVVAGVWLLAVPRGRNRIAAVRVLFAGCEKARDFLLVYKPPMNNGRAKTPASLRVYHFRQRANLSVMDYETGKDTTEFLGIDLREPKDAARVEKVLAGWDVNEPLADLVKKRTMPKDVAVWLANLEGGSELVGIAPSLSGSEL